MHTSYPEDESELPAEPLEPHERPFFHAPKAAAGQPPAALPDQVKATKEASTSLPDQVNATDETSTSRAHSVLAGT